MHRNTAHTVSRTAAGFSLVELVLVMLIIGIVAAITMPRFAQAGARQRLAVAAERVIADIALVRSRANHASDTATLTFNTSDSIYKANAIGGKAFAVELDESPYEVTLQVAGFTDQSYVQFNGYGIAQSTGTITLSNTAGSVEIVITEHGETRQ
ncbi:MAG: GspH/FimT family pseudopilin [Phycisphaeraceae bacterium]